LIPPAFRGLKDRVLALGPEFNAFIPGPRLSFLARYQPEFGLSLSKLTRNTACLSVGVLLLPSVLIFEPTGTFQSQTERKVVPTDEK